MGWSKKGEETQEESDLEWAESKILFNTFPNPQITCINKFNSYAVSHKIVVYILIFLIFSTTSRIITEPNLSAMLIRHCVLPLPKGGPMLL
jgi:hypothetical protein